MPFDIQNLRPKRVALFSGNYNYVMDGPVRALNNLVGFLEEQGIEVLVFAPTADEPAFEHKGTLISVPSFALPGRSEYRVAAGLPRSIKKILRDFDPQLIHLAAPDLLGCGALKWAQKNRVPAVSSFHTRFDTYPRYYHLGWLEPVVTAFMRRFYNKCEQVYVPSDCMRNILNAQNMAHDIRIWTRGVDARLFSPGKRDMAWRKSLGIQENDMVITFVGRLVLEKGLDVFADTLNELRKRGVPFKALVVGEGPERDYFAKRLKDGHFCGYLQGEDLARAYASSDIFFNTSITETFGNVTLEAMCSGVPAVCADASGSRSLVTSGETGYLVEPGNAHAFADKLETLISDPTLRTAMAKASMQASAKYSWNAVLTNLLEQYEEALTRYWNRRPHVTVRRDTHLAK
ncbi:MAG: glycosyltransferase family 1 protein [Alphaproteobacteria bacterium]|nr:glycosyltransferase family 1 protein [Alphaproteobacteria bacterium]